MGQCVACGNEQFGIGRPPESGPYNDGYYSIYYLQYITNTLPIDLGRNFTTINSFGMPNWTSWILCNNCINFTIGSSDMNEELRRELLVGIINAVNQEHTIMEGRRRQFIFSLQEVKRGGQMAPIAQSYMSSSAPRSIANAQCISFGILGIVMPRIPVPRIPTQAPQSLNCLW